MYDYCGLCDDDNVEIIARGLLVDGLLIGKSRTMTDMSRFARFKHYNYYITAKLDDGLMVKVVGHWLADGRQFYKEMMRIFA